MVYAIDDDHSFDQLTDIAAEIEQVKKGGSTPTLALVGNKLDLDDKRAVLIEEGEEWAAQHACPFSETSAKMNQGVRQVFMNIARRILDARREESTAIPSRGTNFAGHPEAPAMQAKPKSFRCILL